MRLKSEFWVKGYLRRCAVAGAPAVVVHRGDPDAGAIYISIDRLDGTVSLYGPAPAGLDSADEDRQWIRMGAAEVITSADAHALLARQLDFDSDIWIVEVEERQGRHFLDDALLAG
jgi:hypothetical protein